MALGVDETDTSIVDLVRISRDMDVIVQRIYSNALRLNYSLSADNVISNVYHILVIARPLSFSIPSSDTNCCDGCSICAMSRDDRQVYRWVRGLSYE